MLEGSKNLPFSEYELYDVYKVRVEEIGGLGAAFDISIIELYEMVGEPLTKICAEAISSLGKRGKSQSSNNSKHR